MPSQVEDKYFQNNLQAGSVWIGGECYFAALANSQIVGAVQPFLPNSFNPTPIPQESKNKQKLFLNILLFNKNQTGNTFHAFHRN